MSAPAPEPTRRSAVGRLLGWVVGLAILALAVVALRGRWEDVAAGGGLPGVVPVALALVANVGGNVLMVAAWRYAVGLTGTPLGFGAAARIWSASQLTRLAFAPAPVGARAAMARRYGITPIVAGTTAAIELAWAVSIGPMLLLFTLPGWEDAAPGYSWLALLGLVPLAVILTSVVSPATVLRWIQASARLPLVRRLLSGPIATDLDIEPSAGARLAVLYLANAALRVGAYLAFVVAAGGDLSEMGLRAVGAFALGQVVGNLAVLVPAGIGPREGATALLLAPAIGGGPALVVVAATRLAELVAELAFAGAVRVVRSGADREVDPAPRES